MSIEKSSKNGAEVYTELNNESFFESLRNYCSAYGDYMSWLAEQGISETDLQSIKQSLEPVLNTISEVEELYGQSDIPDCTGEDKNIADSDCSYN